MKLRTIGFSIILASAALILACAVPAWVNAVAADAEAAAPIAGSLIDVVDPSLAPLVTIVENGFNALVNTLNTYKASPSATHLEAVQAAFHAVDANVAQLESAAKIKNAGTQATVTAVVELLAQAVTEISAQVPAAAASAALTAPVQVHGQAKNWKAKDFKREFNKIVNGDPRFKLLK